MRIDVLVSGGLLFASLLATTAAAQSVSLMAIVVTLTVVQFRYVERKVQY